MNRVAHALMVFGLSFVAMATSVLVWRYFVEPGPLSDALTFGYWLAAGFASRELWT